MLDGVRLLTPDMHRDDRGFFCQVSDESLFSGGRECVARSRMSVIRGLHIRSGKGEDKLVRCSSGAIFDVVVDLRKDSPTYRHWEGFWLDGEKQESLFIPAGCAHGYQAITDDVDVIYRISGVYDPAEDLAIAWDDPELAIEWPLFPSLMFASMSERDRNAPSLAEVEKLL